MWSIKLLILIVTLHESIGANSGWNDAPNTQYHIQTDEGPERFFRYQTVSGQYRKEKRLQDGTVVGTSGWVDPNGYLRLQDYIADTKGYRILKSKMVFVGNNQIQDAITASKSVPASNGILVSPGPTNYQSTTPAPPRTPSYVRYSPNSIETNTKPPIVEIKPHGNVGSIPNYQLSTVTPVTFSPIDHSDAIVSTTPSPPTSTYLPPSSSYSPSSTYLPPSSSYLPPTSAPPLSSTLLPPSVSSYSEVPQVLINSGPALNSRPPRPYSGYTGGPNYEHPWAYEVGGKPPRVDPYNNHIGDGYTPQFPEYDGVSVTQNGFRYYLPRQYHEEETANNNDRSGSFGYIDPFGIRRVIYYNAGEGKGFVHRKNNRYVGFNATPYDPRPY